MANNKAVQIAVQLDVAKLNEGAASLSGLNDIAKQIGAEFLLFGSKTGEAIAFR